MTKRIFVTATNTDIGKTYTTKLLLKQFASLGYRVGVIKPIETGVVDGVCPDGDALLALVQELNPAFKEMTIEDIVPITYELPAAPYVASNAAKLDVKKITNAVKKIENICDILIIEGAGGLYVPIDDRYMMIDLIGYLNAVALLVTHCSLGCINDTLLSQKALNDTGISYITAFNCKESDRSFASVSEPYLLKQQKNVLKVESDIDTISQLLYNL
ncbi:dethiobiotin synthase [Sulfurimonas sp.]